MFNIETVYNHELEIKLRNIQDLKEKLSLIDISSPSRADKVKKKLYKKLLIKAEEEISKHLNLSKLPLLEW